jgi:UDP-N-acetylmuramyl pentapeptide phosphotransferase/UDP-N-acetylglucosamine-1-phosphate transferase
LTDALSMFAATLGALLVSIALVLTKHRHGHLSIDSAIGVQKFHIDPTPRVGGLGIYAGLLLAWWAVPDAGTAKILVTLLVAGLPTLVFGLGEDVTKRVSVQSRLLATMSSGVLAWLLTDQVLRRLGLPMVDRLLLVTPLAVAVTAFSVGGVANAVNIIDGFHGLASGIATIALLAIGIIAGWAGDRSLASASFLVAAAVVGFGIVNYPFGKLFMGDGGAYFTGFALGWLAVLLPMRNEAVSPWASLLVCSYPITEVLYSIVRRWRHRRSAGTPDRLHLHSLLKTRIVRTKLSFLSGRQQNAAVAPMLWVSSLLPTGLALAFYDNTEALMAGTILTVTLYHLAYRSLIQMSERNPQVQSAGQTS